MRCASWGSVGKGVSVIANSRFTAVQFNRGTLYGNPSRSRTLALSASMPMVISPCSQLCRGVVGCVRVGACGCHGFARGRAPRLLGGFRRVLCVAVFADLEKRRRVMVFRLGSACETA